MQPAKKTNLLDVLKEEKKQRELQRQMKLQVSQRKSGSSHLIREESKEQEEEPKTPEFTISNSDDQISEDEFTSQNKSNTKSFQAFAKENDSKDKKHKRNNSSFPTSLHSDGGLKTTGETFQSDGGKNMKRSTNLIDLARRPESSNSSSFL